MPLERYQKEHLVALYLTAKELTEEIEVVAIQGVIRDGSGRPTTPLPEREWVVAECRMRQIREALRRVVRQHAGDLLPSCEDRTRVSRTRDWILGRLDELEELLQDLEAERVAERWGQEQRDAGGDPAVISSLEAAATDPLSSLWNLRQELERGDQEGSDSQAAEEVA